jgi:hypothetical protein
MERRLFLVFLVLVCSFVMAQENEDMYKTARLLIYGENPVLSISKVNDRALENLIDYAMKGTDPKSIKQLNDDDSWLLSFLCFAESNRRNSGNKSEYLLYIQERNEWLETQPMSGKTGRATGWLMFIEMAIRTNQLSVGK